MVSFLEPQEARLKTSPVARWPSDYDYVIAAAVAARAELIGTGDRKHLLPIGSYQGIAIVTAREVLDRLEARLKA